MMEALHWLDFLIVALFLAISATIGIIFAIRSKLKKKNNVHDFNVGSRQLSTLPVAISTTVSLFSATAMLGMPVETYTSGAQYSLFSLACILGSMLAALLFVPLLYPLRLTSSQEYMERRFKSKASKLTATLFIVIYTVFYTSVAIYSPSTALQAITGLQIWTCLLIVGVVSCVTALGGIRAVVYTDVLQFSLMIASIIAIIIQASIKVGGMGEIWRINKNSGRINFFNFDPDPTVRHTFWTIVVLATFQLLSFHGVNQVSVQRYSSVKTLASARLVVLLNMPLWVISISLLCLSGMAIFAYYHVVGCDPIAADKLESVNHLMPFFVADVMRYPGFIGFYMASLLSGSLSSVTSAQSSLSAVVWEDLLKRRYGHLVEWKKMVISRIIVLVFAVITVALAFVASFAGGSVIQLSMSFAGAAGGPLLGMFILGGMFPWANWKGAVSGGFAGMAMALWVAIGAFVSPRGPRDYLPTNTSQCFKDFLQDNVTSMTTAAFSSFTSPDVTMTTAEPLESEIFPLYRVSYLSYPAIGALTTVIVGLTVSFLTGYTKSNEVDPKLLIPFFDRLCCCCVKSCRRKLWCGVDYDAVKLNMNGEDQESDSGSLKLKIAEQPLNLKVYSNQDKIFIQ